MAYFDCHWLQMIVNEYWITVELSGIVVLKVTPTNIFLY